MKTTDNNLTIYIPELDNVHAKPRNRTKVDRADFVQADVEYDRLRQSFSAEMKMLLPTTLASWLLETDRVQIHGFRHTWLTDRQLKRYQIIKSPNAEVLLRAWVIQQLPEE